MDHQMLDFISVCRDLGSEKKKDRSNAAAQLKNFLNHTGVKKALDKNFEQKQTSKSSAKIFTWENVFKATCLYLNLETEEIKHARDNVSQATLTRRESKTQEAVSLMKSVIRTADRGGPKLKGVAVFTYIAESLEDKYMCSAYGQDFCSILLRNILSVRKYVVELTTQQWHDMLLLIFKLFNDLEVKLDQLLLARVIYTLICGITAQCDVRPKKILSFFLDFFINVKKYRSPSMINKMMMGLNVFVRAIAPSSRLQICKLGEDILPYILYLWHSMTDPLKDSIVEFVQLQMWCHHPAGVKEGSIAAFAADWDKWRSSLRKMYEVLYNEIQHIGNRNRSKENGLKEGVIDLAVDVCQQLFSESSHAIEVTQMTCESGDGVGRPGAKKRRLESGWAAIRDFISGAGQTVKLIPWLQLVTRMFEKYQSSLPSDEIVPYLQCIANVLSECKRNDLISHILKCCEGFVCSWPVFKRNMSSDHIEMCSQIWSRIWADALRYVSLHHGESGGYQLLSAILMQDLVLPGKEIWSFFIPLIRMPVSDSVKFLAVFLKCCDLPEKHKEKLASLETRNSNEVMYPLRKQLIDWLLPTKDGDEEGTKVRCKTDPDWTAQVLFMLMLRNPGSLPESQTVSRKPHLNDLETWLLRSYLEMTLKVERIISSHANEADIESIVHIPVLMREIETIFHRDVQVFCRIKEYEITDIEDMVDYATVLLKIISYLLRYKILSCTTLSHGNMYELFVRIMKKLTTSTLDLVKKSGCISVQSIIVKLQKLFTWKEENKELNCNIGEVCRSVTPSRLIDTLMDISKEKNLRPLNEQDSNNSRDRGSHWGRARVLDDFDDLDGDPLDIEFDDRSARNNNLDIEVEIEDSQDSDDSRAVTEVFTSLLRPAVISETQRLRLDAVQTLCNWCSYCREGSSSQLKSEVDVKYIRSKLINLLTENSFDVGRPVDIQIMVLIINSMTETAYLSDTEKTVILDAIRNVVKLHRKDQQICRVGLEMLINLVHHLQDSDGMVSPALRECRDSFLQLVNVFWKLQGDDSFSSEVRQCLVKLLDKIIEIDPKYEWSKFPCEGDSDSQQEGPMAVSRLVECMGDYCHMVRMQGSAVTYRLFVYGETINLHHFDRDRQERAFEQLYDVLFDSLDVQGRLSEDRLQDETDNRIASVLTSLATVICTSVVCEKKAVFTCLKIMKEKHVPWQKIQHMFQKVSAILGYRSAEKFVEGHLTYIIHKWLNMQFKIQEFPHQFCACETLEQFYRRYSNILLPELINKRDIESVKLVCERLGCDIASMVKECIPSIVVHMIPLFAANKLEEYSHDEQIRRRTAKATSSYNLLVEQLSEEATEQEIVNNLDTVVINILCCLHDGEEQNDDINNILPEPNPPSYNTHLITGTLEYLTKSFSGSGKSLVEILSKSPDSIQKILLHLALLMRNSHRLSEKRQILQIYKLFTKLLLESFDTELGGAWAYILRELVVRLVHLLQDTQSMDVSCGFTCVKDSILLTTCRLLQDVCSVSVKTCVEEFKKYLPVITSNIIPLAKGSGEVAEEFLNLLKFLILEKAKVLQSAIITLDEFPDYSVLKDCKKLHHRLKYADGTFSLKQEIEHFLNTSHSYYVSPELRLDGLKFLQDKLAAHRDSLLQLTKDGTISRLMFELIRLTKCSNKDVVMEAGKCLGLIGPINLNTISLPSQNGNQGLEMALKTFQETPEVQKYCKIFHYLNSYLTDKSMDLVQCTSQVLKVIMSTKTGVEFCTGYKARLGDSEFLFHYLHPFRPSKKKTVHQACKTDWQAFVTSVDQETLWNPHHSDHELWVITLTTTLINSGAVRDEILSSLSPVCSMKSKFCEMILPYLIHDILRSGNEDHAELLSRQVDSFFTCHCGQSSTFINRCQSVTSVSVPTGDEYICMNVDSIRTMIDVIQYLREQQRPKVGRKEMTAWDNNFWLGIDYLQVAMAAQYCSSHFSTILYAEIWCDVQREKGLGRGSQKSYSQSLSQETRIDTLSDSSSCHSVSIQDLLLVAYKWIGDPDGVYGCGAGRKADMSSRICTYQQENQWDKAVISCDIQMNQSAISAEYDLLHALQNFGTSHIFSTYLQGIMGKEDTLDMTSDIRELQYEAAWKMGQWNLDTSIKLSDKTGYNESVYKALRAVREADFVSGTGALQHARLSSISCLKDSCVDSAKRLYPILANLQCISVIEDASSFLQSVNGFTDRQWDSVITSCDNDFDFVLPILYTRCSSLNITWEKSKDKEMFNLYVNSLLGLATMARESKRHEICERAVNTLKMLEITDLQQSLSVQIEEARLYWCREEQNVAKCLMRTIIDKVKKLKSEDRVAAKYYPQVLSIYGNWLAETRSENPNVIMENYLEKTVRLFEQLGEDIDLSMDAYLSLGRYADNHYQNIVNYMKSSTYEAKRSLMEKAKLEAERLREFMGEQAKDRYLRTLEKQGEIDKNELICLEEDKIRFLLTAVQNYLHCLRCGDAHNLRIFRLTSLWFSNSDNEEVNQLIEEGIKDIPTYKWIPLMYQLAARMDVKSQQNASFQFLAILDNVIQRTAIDHPHHTLFCILALANANRDTDLMQQARTSKRTGKMSMKSQAEREKEEGRVQAAKNMIQRLLQDDKVGKVVNELQGLCDAYIQLANWNVSQHKTETKPIQFPSALWISKVVDLQNVPVPTRDIHVEKSGNYESISYIHKFQPTFKLAGGINLPKIISCVGSDGRSSRQLVKGKDDLRQDAVMQQVFDMVNNLLQKNNETRKRCLQIRKYKVIPLSQTSGLLEWCEGTQPIGEYLIGSAHSAVKGAHERYRPQDWSAYQCRKHLTEGSTIEEKMKTYLEICVKFQPVFRHFLMEKFVEPAVWLERRLSYTRSVATNSIVGYILGLGDRHVQNILIDCHSAELVHIDLGVAFEQGEILPTPETVPFRLTRDIEDAMGSSGVEGVFRRCCEKTMEVMRNNQEALLTILEVLLHDPLHAWTISPAKAYALQQRLDKNIHQDTLDITNTTGDINDMAESTSFSACIQENKNKLAERVLLRLREKLQGIEDGVQLSLQGQVNHLIQEARNPKNLARLFPGWQPYI